MGNSGPTSGQSETTRLVNWHLKLVGGGEDCGTEFLNYGGKKSESITCSVLSNSF